MRGSREWRILSTAAITRRGIYLMIIYDMALARFLIHLPNFHSELLCIQLNVHIVSRK